MKPSDPVGTHKLSVLHALFRRIGPDGETGMRDAIEQMTGQRSCTGLSEAQAWDLIDRMHVSLGEANGIPIAVDWCPVYQRGRATLDATPGGNSRGLPSQAQVWHLHQAFRAGRIENPRGFLARRFWLKDGVIRTAEDAWWIAKSLRRIGIAAQRSPQTGRRTRRSRTQPLTATDGTHGPRA